MRRLAALLAVPAFLVACGDTIVGQPFVEGVFPDLFATDRSRYVLIEGQDFDPRFVYHPGTGQLVADTEYTVLFGETEAPAVHYADRNALVAAVPTTLSRGTHTLTVRAPTGLEASLEKAFCVGDGEPAERVHLCPFVRGAEFVNRICATPFGSPLNSSTPISGVTAESFIPYSLSPDGEVLVYFAEENARGKIPLVLLRPWGDQQEYVAAELDGLGDEIFAPMPPVFSPDGRYLAYVDGGQRLMVLDIPAAEETPSPPRELLAVFDDLSISSPSIDPSTRWVLFSVVRERDADPYTTLGEIHRLMRVPLLGGEADEIFPGSPVGQSDGPAVFLASGDRILFQSTRLGLRTPVGDKMPEVTLLYVLDLSTREVTSVTRPMNLIYLSQLAVSPDGRWAAGVGHLSDLTGSLIDLILTNLETGDTFRAEKDVRALCLGITPENCPTFELTPAFAPDSRTVTVTAVQYATLDADTVGMYVIEVTLPTQPLDVPDGDRTIDPSQVRRLPVAPDAFPVNVRIRETLTGCDP